MLRAITLFVCLCTCAGPRPAPTTLEDHLPAATALAERLLIVDTHIDVPYRLWESRDGNGSLTEDVSQRTPKGDFDYPRAKTGGLDAAFMSIYIPASHQEEGGAKQLADDLISMVEQIAQRAPEKFAVAKTTDEVRAAQAKGVVTFPLGIENGAAIEADLANLAHFHARGVRYITLTHSRNNLICDSSYDDNRTWHGLSPFGGKVVAEMNRLGIMIDVSHVSDDAFYDVVALTKVPVVASHSSCRLFTPGFERNMSDAMIRALAKNGGVLQVNFGSTFVDAESLRQGDAMWDAGGAYRREHNLTWASPEMEAWSKTYKEAHPFPYASVQTVADHIDHVVRLVGVDHVGLGSDFDGVGDTLPEGLKDVSMYPQLIAELLRRGYDETAIAKICGENLMRVWTATEAYARSTQL